MIACRKAAFILAFFLQSFAATAAAPVQLIYTGDLMGELEPCGCRTNPLGGMVRLFNDLKRLPSSGTAGTSSLTSTFSNRLYLDAGDLLFPTSPVPPLLARQSEVQAHYLLRAMEKVGLDAVVPGEKEFGLGFAAFERLRMGTETRFLAANLQKRKGGKFLEPYSIFVKKDGDGKPVKIAVLGLVGEKLAWPKELRASSAQAAALKWVPILRKKAQWVFVLSHQGLDDDLKLAKAVPGIDAVFGAHSQSFLQTPREVMRGHAKVILFQTSFRNQYVGHIPLLRPLGVEGHALRAMDAGLDDSKTDPKSDSKESPSEMGLLVSEFKAALAKVNAEEDVTKLPHLERDGSTSHLSFQTFPKCAECHQTQFEFWRKTQHVHALQALVDQKQAQNKECLSCHTVGLGQSGGFNSVTVLAERHPPLVRVLESESETDETTKERPSLSWNANELAFFLNELEGAKSYTSDIQLERDKNSKLPVREAMTLVHTAWAPVQCENCHGAAEGHPFTGQYSKKVEISACLKCHSAERAPDWYSKGVLNESLAKEKFKKVMCPRTPDGSSEGK